MSVTGERFVMPRWQRALLSAMLALPGVLRLVLEVLRPTPAALRALPGALGIPLGAWPFLLAIEGVALGGLMWLFQLKTMTVVLTRDGLTMYRGWKLRWDDVTSARVRKILGLRYVHVMRARRLQPSLWLPLYFVGNRLLSIALHDHAPIENPIRKCLDVEPAEAGDASLRSSGIP
jgi:hypothetical protein